MSDRHSMGGNNPPLAERLELDHAALIESAKEALALVPETIRAIANDEEAGGYTDAAKELKDAAKLVDAAFEAAKAPIRKDGVTVDKFFQTLSVPLIARAKLVVGEINRYQTAKIAAANKAAAEAAERERKAAILFDEPAPAPAAPVVAREAGRVISFSGTKATASKKWVGEVTNLEAVPRQYLRVNQAAIDAAVAGGTREIPGVNIFENVRTSIR